MSLLTEEQREKVMLFAMKNRLEYGKTSPKHVFSIFAKEFKGDIDFSKVKQYIEEIKKICNYVDSLSEEELTKRVGVPLREENREGKKAKTLEDLVLLLKPLPKANDGEVVTRFEPSPSGPLHLGHIFPLLLNYWYAKKYKGKFILRIADTNPKNILPEAYNMIVEDVEYLTGELFEPLIQSENMGIYYETIEYLLQNNFAYACTCSQDSFKEYLLKGKPCPHRDQAPEQNMEIWERMLSGEFNEGEVVIRVKTSLSEKNIALRDWVACRVIKEPHPLHGDKYCAYPTMNLAVAVDDYRNGITHVIRGKDHEINTVKQRYIFDYMDWKTPFYIHIGRINFEDIKLSTTKTKEKILRGEFEGWDDVRLPFIRSFKRRGFKPEAFSYWVLNTGLTKRDKKATYKEFMKNFVKIHRALIDKESNRYFFIKDKVKIKINNLKEDIVVKLPKHPEEENRGYRFLNFSVEEPYVYLERKDWESIKEGDELRLKYAFTIKKVSEKEADIVKNKEGNLKIVHYLPEGCYVQGGVIMPDGNVIKGIMESNIIDEIPPSRVQFERFGFVKLDKIDRNLYIYVETYYIHD